MWRNVWVLGIAVASLVGLLAPVQAETLAGQVKKVDTAAREIEIDGVRYKLPHSSSRESRDVKPLLSRLKPGDGVIYTPGPGQTLLKLEKPAAGVDLPNAAGGKVNIK